MNAKTLLDILMIVFLIIMLVRLVKKIRNRKPEQKPFSLMVISQCKSCNKKCSSKFKEGDYLFKPYGKCTCGKTLRIVKIYTEEDTEKERKWRAYIKKFEV